ncbi:MAG: hypothetical protein M3070_16965, partial [Actinomycetota bacterium]|nr:hypothetical protein [Actinomycetota bacterium]
VMVRALPSLGQAGLVALQMITMLALANRVAGGVVGFQIAVNFYFLAVALGATPVALSLLPRLARMHRDGDLSGFRDTLAHGYALGLFLAIPTAAAYLVLAMPIARAVSFGRMASAGGAALVAGALAGLALAVVGQTIFMIGSYACYARKDTRSPLSAMAMQAVVCLALASTSLATHGTAALAVIGLAFAVSTLVSGVRLSRRLRRLLGPGRVRLSPALSKAALGSLVMAGPAWLIAVPARPWLGGTRISLLVAAVVGAVLFVAVQAAVRSDELRWLAAGLSQLRGRSAAPVIGIDRG